MDPRKSTNREEFREERLVRLLSQTLFTIFFVILVVIVVGFTVREELIQISETILKKIGYWGLFIGMFLSDSLPAFVPPDAFLMLSIAGGMDSFWVLVSTSAGSILGGFASYSFGRFVIPKFSLGRKFVLKYEDQLLPYLKSYGFWAVVLSAITPIPFSWMAYTVGTFKMHPFSFFLGACFRIPRMVVYYYAMLWGWIQ